ncbi:MAG: hypothetical protein COZ12_01550 [Deltaproteobacteria bacterium CG_4_10_14_3_um_filter_60_8]|nr:MAG: hypothetical protein AUK28_08890 [Desulfobacterales bacterium CG2_30_60_27]PIP44413.1 MAG: hypothetical protein COX17_01585 [Deltaproteobacteria bacterium CG23_combo_of_CG06-09_8_20_14_all_60_8]PIY23957.1 MAG: hypothetical protein COZ12_01550 [Deltaproteobacteria bacterium CG_4_10_14_3_um_filter_60_8]
MLANCVHCLEPFDFSEAQLRKLEAALAKLQAGKHLRFKCPACDLAINLRADGSAAEGKREQAGDVEVEMKAAGVTTSALGKPQPPDMGWLAGGPVEKRGGVVEDVPLALILVESGAMKTAVAEAFVGQSYRPIFAKTIQKALESMRFVRYAAIVFQAEFEGKPLAASAFHAYMKNMEMRYRRKVFYALIGPQFHSLYDLEALTNSANLVVNDADVKHFSTILNKSIQDYNDLFGPYLAILQEHGKL